MRRHPERARYDRPAVHAILDEGLVCHVGLVDQGKRRALDVIVEHVVPGRVASVRPPSDVELLATRVVALPLDEASVKVRTGPPLDDAADVALRCWAGVLPLRLSPLEPVADARAQDGAAVPAQVAHWRRPDAREQR